MSVNFELCSLDLLSTFFAIVIAKNSTWNGVLARMYFALSHCDYPRSRSWFIICQQPYAADNANRECRKFNFEMQQRLMGCREQVICPVLQPISAFIAFFPSQHTALP